ncbi:phosphotransferase system HPr-like phosphotransfer protein [Kroppenstedtia sanguinis]|uniref:HPr family phosphocarrier protein n=1 Tax=Kroppenstedtia sanguinis TaxID=1380684 RepID=A0ABW4CEB4_9BACL
MKKGKSYVVLGLILSLLMVSVPSVSAAGKASEELVIRADRIESKGMLLGLGSGHQGLVLKMDIDQSQISGMRMGGSYSSGQGSWGVRMEDSGTVTIQGLSLKANAIGFKIKADDFIRFEKPLQLDSLMPSIVLHDVYLRVEGMEAEGAAMPSLELDTLKEASLARPEGGIWIDLRSGFSSMSSSEAEEKINGILSDELEKEKDEDSSDPSKGKEEEDPEAGEDGKKGEDESPTDSPEVGDPPADRPSPGPGTSPDDGGQEGVNHEKTVKLHRYFTALEIVNQAKKYSSKLTLRRGDKEYNGKDWGRMVLIRRLPGTEITVTAEGPDAGEAVQGMARFLGGN